MNFRHGVYILLLAAFTLILPSCLGNDDEEDIFYPQDAQLFSFQLTHDSISDLSKVFYTIDQLNSYIFNADSMAYGSELPEKAVFNFTTPGYSVVVLNAAREDSVALASGDSIGITPFINNKTPYLRVYAYDGSKKDYYLDLRVHTIDPDSMIYTRLNATLPTFEDQKTVFLNGQFYCIAKGAGNSAFYTSSNAEDWTPSPAANFPADAEPASLCLYGNSLAVLSSGGELYISDEGITSWEKFATDSSVESVVAILGEVKELATRISPTLALIVKSEGKQVFARTESGAIVKGNEVPASFPVKDYASVSWIREVAFRSLLLVIGGLTEDGQPSTLAWSNTDDGITWVSDVPKVFQGKGKDFDVPYQAPNMVFYDGMIYLMNGSREDAYNDKAYTSIDGGRTWKEMPSKYNPLSDFTLRKKASVCVGADHFLYILGGQNNATVLNEVWKARLNRLGF